MQELPALVRLRRSPQAAAKYDPALPMPAATVNSAMSVHPTWRGSWDTHGRTISAYALVDSYGIVSLDDGSLLYWWLQGFEPLSASTREASLRLSNDQELGTGRSRNNQDL